MALGASLAGFDSLLALEWEKNSCNTLRLNSHLLHKGDSSRVLHDDVRNFDPSSITSSFDLLLGGPPCQPFSIGGQKKGYDDQRDLFPEYLRILKAAKPSAFIIENVKGITAKRFESYLDFIKLQLAHINHLPKKMDDWNDQLNALLKLNNKNAKPDYRVEARLLNAVDYGIPQSRHRLFIVGIRSDLSANWKWPATTHSEEALLYSKYVSGEYFERHRLKREKTPPELIKRIEQIKTAGTPKLKPWSTVRDALVGLPEPTIGIEHSIFKNHIGIDGARSYPGHTGSPYDLPAKTLKAGVHGCPGGENMLAYPDGKVRYFSVRESARLQTFPDNYVFVGARSECMRQIGNAVPVALAQLLVSSVKKILSSSSSKSKTSDRLYSSKNQLNLEL